MARKTSTYAVASEIREHTLAGLVWKEQYNCYSTRLGGWLTLSIVWDGSRGYKVGFPGMRLKAAHFKSAEEAAKALVGYAKEMLEKALEEVR